MTWSEESMTLVTAYRLPRHGYRSIAAALDDALWFSSPWIQILRIHSG